MKIATWNVNSVRARLESLNVWIQKALPDVILLQEIKCQEEAFPYEFFENFGFSCKVLGQKSYNGVAIISRYSIEDSVHGLPTFPEDSSSRYIEALIDGHIRVASLYVPNGGQIIGSENYIYKLEFLKRLKEHLNKLNQYQEIILIGGDYNIAPDDFDVYDEKVWHDRVCCTQKERDAFFELMQVGFSDLLQNVFMKDEKNHGQRKPFTWWDYRTKTSFLRNMGLRLDHFLTNQCAEKAALNIFVDAETRTLVRPSDHAPVICELKI